MEVIMFGSFKILSKQYPHIMFIMHVNDDMRCMDRWQIVQNIVNHLSLTIYQL